MVKEVVEERSLIIYVTCIMSQLAPSFDCECRLEGMVRSVVLWERSWGSSDLHASRVIKWSTRLDQSHHTARLIGSSVK